MNVGEYNTLDLVKDNTNKKTCVFYIFFCSIIFEMQEKGHNIILQFRQNLDFGH